MAPHLEGCGAGRVLVRYVGGLARTASPHHSRLTGPVASEHQPRHSSGPATNRCGTDSTGAAIPSRTHNGESGVASKRAHSRQPARRRCGDDRCMVRTGGQTPRSGLDLLPRHGNCDRRAPRSVREAIQAVELPPPFGNQSAIARSTGDAAFVHDLTSCNTKDPNGFCIVQ